jgi:3-hydroxyisobutyrate dehydrogenase-like beta-hydroxyacid dehydrogenase
MHPNNRTRFKTLDRVAADPRVKKVYQDSDGIWIDLAEGFNFEDCSSIRRDTVREALNDFARVEEGSP